MLVTSPYNIENLACPSPLMRDSHCTGIGLSIPHHPLCLEPEGKSHRVWFLNDYHLNCQNTGAHCTHISQKKNTQFCIIGSPNLFDLEMKSTGQDIAMRFCWLCIVVEGNRFVGKLCTFLKCKL